MEDISSDRINKLRIQIEYYLSDKNLEGDKFFNEKIREDLNGYVDVAFLLNCNKIKALDAKEDEIVKAIKDSTLLEIDASEKKLRRKDNKPIPALKLLSKKRKNDDGRGDENNDENPDLCLDPFILEISADKPIEFKWKNIQDEFKILNPDLNVVYLRFKDSNGHIGIYKKTNDEIKFVPEFEIEGVKFIIKKCEGDNLINFWKEHGSHFEFCVGKTKTLDRKKKPVDKNRLKNSVTLGDETFSEVAKIRTRIRNILVTNKDGDRIPSPDHEFLKDLLQYHYNYAEKVKDLEYFTTGAHSAHSYSRCFYIVKNDEKQTKTDFSAHKCLERLYNFNDKREKLNIQI